MSARTANLRAAEQQATDTHPSCPRCSDLLAPGARYCPECGCAVTVDNAVEGGDNGRGA